MRIASLLFPLLAYSHVPCSVVDANENSLCGTIDPTLADVERLEREMEEVLQKVGGDDENLPRRQRIIDVSWHVIHDGGLGYLTRDEILYSVEVLNRDFDQSGSNFQFDLVDITYTDNATWFHSRYYPWNENRDQYKDMLNSLAEGDCSTMNVFSTDFDDILGFYYHYTEIYPNSEDCIRGKASDGIWVRFDQIPRQISDPKELTHQAGHWMGLLHTYEFGCDGFGDFVDDTPAVADVTSGCPLTKPDTCPDQDGLDPIENYMDYACRKEFSRGQVRRMRTIFYAVRVPGDFLGEVIDSGSSCFSPHATAIVKGKGKLSMKEISVGDEVLTATGQYQTVYTISHFHPSEPTNFLKLHTDLVGNENERALEVSPMHLIYMEGKPHPVPAIKIQVGDYLQTLTHGPQKVQAIQHVTRNGLYNPITEGGTILVDGIIVSSYTSFTGGAYLEVAGIELISVHNLVSMTVAPYRVFCMATSFLRLDTCNQHVEGDLPVAVQLVQKYYDIWSQQSVPIQILFISMHLCCFTFITFVLTGCGAFTILAVLIGWFALIRDNKRKGYQSAVKQP